MNSLIATTESLAKTSGPAGSRLAVAPGADRTVRVLTAAQLRENVDYWQDLVESTLEPNVFYEPFMLLPALAELEDVDDLEFAVIDAGSGSATDGRRVWCGFFPLGKRQSFGLPISYRSLWKSAHCYLCAPLVRADGAAITMAAFVAWMLERKKGRALWKLGAIPGEGPLHQLLIDELRNQGANTWLSERHTRAVFEPRANAEEFLAAAVPSKRRQEHRRLAKRLAEQGKVEFRVLQSGDDLSCWLDDFLRLESAGWKGREGTALAAVDSGRSFFANMAHEAFRNGQLVMTALVLNGNTIAQNCKLRSGAGAFAFKTAYCEQYRQFSPGVLLELHNIGLHHETGGPAWIDSCADADHGMINTLWRSRRTLETLWVAGSSRTAGLALSLLPLVRGLNRGFSARRS